MADSADPDQLASSEANIWMYTVCKGRLYPGSAGLGLNKSCIFFDRCDGEAWVGTRQAVER